MNSEDALRTMITQLETAKVDYVLVGAFSSNLYGVPRSTNDADIEILFNSIDLISFCNELGPDFRLNRQMMLEGFTGSTRNVVTFLPTDFDIELFRLTDDAHLQERFSRRRRMKLANLNCEAWVPTVEDVVIQKLRWGRRKDLDDVVNVLTVSGDKIDWSYVESWVTRHKTADLLKQLREEADV